MIRYLIAMPREAEMFKRFAHELPEGTVDVIGINAVDLGYYSEDDVLVNIGYAGGYKIPVGTLIEPSFVFDIYTEEAARVDPIFPLEHRLCFTSNEFVEMPKMNVPSIYDMELFKIARCTHKRLHAIKIVSDNLDEKACEGFNDEASWARAAALISQYLKDG